MEEEEDGACLLNQTEGQVGAVLWELFGIGFSLLSFGDKYGRAMLCVNACLPHMFNVEGYVFYGSLPPTDCSFID